MIEIFKSSQFWFWYLTLVCVIDEHLSFVCISPFKGHVLLEQQQQIRPIYLPCDKTNNFFKFSMWFSG